MIITLLKILLVFDRAGEFGLISWTSGTYTITASVVSARSHESYNGVVDTVESYFIPDFDFAGVDVSIPGVHAKNTFPDFKEGGRAN